jgi:hypothetical protein
LPKTGAEGYTIAHLIPSEAIYNIIVLKNGVVLATFEDIVANCQSQVLEDCDLNLNSYSTSTLPNSFKTNDDLTFTLTYNETTRDVESITSVISGGVSEIKLNVTLFDNIGNKTICSDSLVGSGGALSCTVPASYGNSTVIAVLFKDGVRVGQTTIKIKVDPKNIYGSNLLFIALFSIFIIIGIAITDNPMTYGIIFIIGVISMFALNIVYTPSFIGVGATVLWLVIAVALILIKGSDRQ